MTQVYRFDDTELLDLVNTTMISSVEGLRLEGFLTQDQADKIFTNYSVVVESTGWVPKSLATWLGLKEDKIKLRLVKAIGRTKA